MRKLLCVVVGLSVLIAHPVISAGAKSKGKGKGKAPDMEAEMKAMAKFAAPGAPHKALESLVGSWEFTMKMWMQPKAPPMESKGTSEAKSIFDGRFLVEEASGDFMGMPFKGMGITGYDNFRKRYQNTWCDNMGTVILVTSGTMSKDGKTLTMSGKMDDVASGKRDQAFKIVIKIVSNDKHVSEMWAPSKQGKPYKVMELTSTRK